MSFLTQGEGASFLAPITEVGVNSVEPPLRSTSGTQCFDPLPVAGTKTRNNETKRNLLAVSFYLLVRAVLYIFVSFRFVSFRVSVHAISSVVEFAV